LRRAAEAERGNDLEKRTQELNHALLVIAHLEDRVTRGSGGELADQLTGFYRLLRRKIIEAQAKRSAAILEEQMNLVLKLREAWQGLEMRGISARPEGGSWDNPASYPGGSAASFRQGASHWSA
jgi:flagellar biosynthetic protein FliS